MADTQEPSREVDDEQFGETRIVEIDHQLGVVVGVERAFDVVGIAAAAELDFPFPALLGVINTAGVHMTVRAGQQLTRQGRDPAGAGLRPVPVVGGGAGSGDKGLPIPVEP